MRKPRDYDAELKALTDKANRLKERKLVQLGELVIATKADVLPVEMLAGALLSAASADAATKEGWRKQGAAFFRDPRVSGDGACANPRVVAARDSGTASGSGEDRAQ
jgi:hypothetical protein